MFDAISAFALLGAIAATSIGAARLVSWVLDRRDYAAGQRQREAQALTLAQLEIAATKSGDLLAAAAFADAQEPGFYQAEVETRA